MIGDRPATACTRPGCLSPTPRAPAQGTRRIGMLLRRPLGRAINAAGRGVGGEARPRQRHGQRRLRLPPPSPRPGRGRRHVTQSGVCAHNCTCWRQGAGAQRSTAGGLAGHAIRTRRAGARCVRQRGCRRGPRAADRNRPASRVRTSTAPAFGCSGWRRRSLRGSTQRVVVPAVYCMNTREAERELLGGRTGVRDVCAALLLPVCARCARHAPCAAVALSHAGMRPQACDTRLCAAVRKTQVQPTNCVGVLLHTQQGSTQTPAVTSRTQLPRRWCWRDSV